MSFDDIRDICNHQHPSHILLLKSNSKK
uniref:AP-2 complex subunit alpha-1-like n=1 Tax=Rhizophora mucronata TaxID=61149 RepID=A0A2P2MSV6_RHIMU